MATEAQGVARVPGGIIRCSLPVAVVPLAQANTDFTFNLPGTARNVTFRTVTTTAFTASTDAQLQVGKTVGGAEYVAGVSVKAAGAVSHALATGAIADLETVPGALGSQTTFTGRLVQTGTATAVGVATLFAEYSIAA